jgi:predicted nucleic acid-binding protein
MYLVDTNIVSELRKGARADPHVTAWASSVAPGALSISAVTLLELEKGVLLAERRDPAQRAMLRDWLDQQVQPAFEGRVIAFDARMALYCAALHVPDPRPERDAMIAATAKVSGLTIVTRNVADFATGEVPVLNPFNPIAPLAQQ